MSSRIDQLVLKVAERCNINCTYCYLYQRGDTTYLARPKFMSENVFEDVLRRSAEYCSSRPGHQITLVLHGGEPTLIGPERLSRMVGQARAVLGGSLKAISMQTNGTRLDSRWAELVVRLGIRVGISIDGSAHVHDLQRVDHRGRGTHTAVVRGLRAMQDIGVEPSVLCVVNPDVDGAEVYRSLRSIGATQIDFLLPDVTHDSIGSTFPELPKLAVGKYLADAFDAWFDEGDPEIEVRLFLGILRALFGGAHVTDQLGNGIAAYLVIETDGSIQPNDVLRICRDGMSETTANVATDAFDDVLESVPLLKMASVDGSRLSDVCQSCPESRVCAGGYLPHRYAARNGFDNPSVWCADLYHLIGHVRGRLGARASTTV